MIDWGPNVEGHVLGKCLRGKIWIRVVGDQVTGLYTLFGEAVKYVPETQEELELSAMKIRAELILENHEFAEKLETQTRTQHRGKL